MPATTVFREPRLMRRPRHARQWALLLPAHEAKRQRLRLQTVARKVRAATDRR
jgi:hypothetical protein